MTDITDITEKQLLANQQNAKLGGVKTEKGKSISKLNALKHGLLSDETILDDEDSNILENLKQRLNEEFKPSTMLELILVDRLISNIWRLKRAMRVEKNLMEWERDNLSLSFDISRNKEEQEERKKIRNIIVNDNLERVLRYETAIERALYKSLHELQRIQAARKGYQVDLPLAVDINISKEE